MDWVLRKEAGRKGKKAKTGGAGAGCCLLLDCCCLCLFHLSGQDDICRQAGQQEENSQLAA